MAKKLTAGQRVRAWRESRSLSIRGLAEESGLHRSTIHRIETGQQDAREPELQALTKGLRVSIAEFYDDSVLRSHKRAAA